MEQNKLTISNILIAIAILFTGISYISRDILIFWMNSYFFAQWEYLYWLLQMFSSQFLHWGPLHLIMNAFFILYFGNVVERKIGQRNLIIFFVWTCIFLGLILTFFTKVNTIGMSWFAMALLSFYTISLYKRWDPEYSGGVTAIVINVAIWFTPGISFLWHAWGVVIWLIFYIIFNTNKYWHKI